MYTNGLNQPLSALIPNTAILLINALVYSLSPKTWSNNDNMNCNIWPSNTSCYCSSSLPSSLLVSESVLLNQLSSSSPYDIISLIFYSYLSCLLLMRYGGLLPSTSLLSWGLATGNSWVRQIYAMISTYALLYLIIVFSVCYALNGFSLVELLNSRRLMYIIAGILTTLALDVCCACYITIRTA
jgi:hypothetical protein